MLFLLSFEKSDHKLLCWTVGEEFANQGPSISLEFSKDSLKLLLNLLCTTACPLCHKNNEGIIYGGVRTK